MLAHGFSHTVTNYSVGWTTLVATVTRQDTLNICPTYNLNGGEDSSGSQACMQLV